MATKTRKTAATRQNLVLSGTPCSAVSALYALSLSVRIRRAWHLYYLLVGLVFNRTSANPGVARAYDSEATYWSSIGRYVTLLTWWVHWTQRRYDKGAPLPGMPERPSRHGVDLTTLLANESAYLEALINALEARKAGHRHSGDTGQPGRRPRRAA